MNLYRLYIIIPVAALIQANTAASLIMPDVNEEFTFSVALSSDGQEPATHYACSTAASEARRLAMLTLLGQGVGTGAIAYRCDLFSDVLEDVLGVELDLSNVGTVWKWSECLTNLGLRTIEDAH